MDQQRGRDHLLLEEEMNRFFRFFRRLLFVFGVRRGECLDPVSGKEKCEGNRWLERNPGRALPCPSTFRDVPAHRPTEGVRCRLSGNSDVTFYESFVRLLKTANYKRNFGVKARQKRITESQLHFPKFIGDSSYS